MLRARHLSRALLRPSRPFCTAGACGIRRLSTGASEVQHDNDESYKARVRELFTQVNKEHGKEHGKEHANHFAAAQFLYQK